MQEVAEEWDRRDDGAVDLVGAAPREIRLRVGVALGLVAGLVDGDHTMGDEGIAVAERGRCADRGRAGVAIHDHDRSDVDRRLHAAATDDQNVVRG